MKINKLAAHIPARSGSKRVPKKNLRVIGDKPMIAYAIESAIFCIPKSDVYVNTDCPEIMSVARSYGVNVYKRDPKLAQDNSTGDDVAADIIKSLGLDTLLMINPVCPFITPTDIQDAIDVYSADPLADTLISCSQTKMQVACEGEFINIDPNRPLPPSQQNPTVQILNWGITIWNCSIFLENFANQNGAYLGTTRILYPIDSLRSIKVSNEDDFLFACALMNSGSNTFVKL